MDKERIDLSRGTVSPSRPHTDTQLVDVPSPPPPTTHTAARPPLTAPQCSSRITHSATASRRLLQCVDFHVHTRKAVSSSHGGPSVDGVVAASVCRAGGQLVPLQPLVAATQIAGRTTIRPPPPQPQAAATDDHTATTAAVVGGLDHPLCASDVHTLLVVRHRDADDALLVLERPTDGVEGDEAAGAHRCCGVGWRDEGPVDEAGEDVAAKLTLITRVR
mmetsp:Transcript_17727/g.50393  ORF Transcript_17727/g.50393 Transcript_17727/m.50393 type:complete len:219 (-) Transcript_17727:170-826(-)